MFNNKLFTKKEQIANLYSQRHYKVDEIQYEKFTKLTGIKVNVVKSNADQLIERLKNEGKNSPADVLYLLMLANYKKHQA